MSVVSKVMTGFNATTDTEEDDSVAGTGPHQTGMSFFDLKLN